MRITRTESILLYFTTTENPRMVDAKTAQVETQSEE